VFEKNSLSNRTELHLVLLLAVFLLVCACLEGREIKKTVIRILDRIRQKKIKGIKVMRE
jgi:predicted PurR-regulated permease PerM